MILEKLIMEDFRQFAGRQTLEFASPGPRNVTLVHAENGFGKTALLNALLWGLYGAEGLTPDVSHPERIVHEGTAARSKNPNKTKAMVRILFQHEDHRYKLTRTLPLSQQRLDPRKTELKLEVMRHGETFQEKLAQPRIQSIVPDGISQFLFFNGERIDHLAMEQSAPKLREAIEQMLGLSIIKRGIDDLSHQNVRGILRTDLRTRTSDEKAKLLDELAMTETAITELQAELERIAENLKEAEAEIELIDNKLEANREAYQLQAERKRLESERKQKEESLKETSAELRHTISEEGYMLFSEELVKQGKEAAQRLRSEGKIPARVLNSFIEELLETENCICKRHLHPGSPEREAVEKLLTVAGDQQFNNAVSTLDNAIGILESGTPRVRDAVTRLNRERLELSEEIEVIENKIVQIHQKLGNKEDEGVRDLEQSRNKMRDKKEKLIEDRGKSSGELDKRRTERDELNTKISVLEDQEADAQQAQRRLDAVEQCIDVLNRILKLETNELRPLLNEEIDRHFRTIIDRGYWAELSEDFVLTIRKELGSAAGLSEEQEHQLEVALSTGQRQITSLVFIASLVALARRRSSIPTILKGVGGAEYPVVMDSPFGQLGRMFREGVAKLVPDLAPQVAILVSSTQFDGPVAEVLDTSGQVGKQYYLNYYGPRLREDAPAEVFLNGEKVQIYWEAEEERTDIVELAK